MFTTGFKPGRPRPEDMLDEEKTKTFLAVLLAIGVLVLWVLPIRSSFWLDETGTFWIVKDGLANLLARSAYWSGQSPLYYLTAWTALVAGGSAEWVLRLPSLAALLVAAWLLYRLADRLFDAATARLAVLFFVCFEPVAFAASDARPYALGLALVIGSALMLVRWLDTGRSRDAAGYIVLSALAIYAHCFFAPVLAVLGLYAAARMLRERRSRFWKLPAAWTAVGFLLLPLVPQLYRFYQSRGVHSFTGAPALASLFAALAPPLLTGSIAGGVFLAWLIAPQKDRQSAARRDSLLLAAVWALAPPAILFAISVISPAKLFIPRYYIGYAPGLCMVAGCVVRAVVDRRGQRLVATVLVMSGIMTFGTLQHGNEDWSGAMRKIRSVDRDGSLPVLAVSGFVEATDPQALDNPMAREVLFAPLAMYPPGGHLVRLPYRLNEESAKYVENILPSLENQRRFVLVGQYQGATFEPWLRGRLAPRGFRSESLGDFGSVGVFLFSRP
jgi:4-amino-4-deoxy-L-arabinose transferase-like glycosyltransferase